LGLDDECLTFAEIARRLGVTRECVRRTHHVRALTALGAGSRHELALRQPAQRSLVARQRRTDVKGTLMTSISEIFVTLSDELLGHLRGLASDLEVPFEWLVAGIVCDTVESSPGEIATSASPLLA
jgi:hypothetical protein